VDHARKPFAAMRDSDGFDLAEIPWFNSGLFEAADCLPLGATELRLARILARILGPLRAVRTSSRRPGLPSTSIDSPGFESEESILSIDR
jgi:hypothetical protein